MNLSPNINPQSSLILYLVSFSDWDYDEYDSFVVVAYTAEEADQLTPDAQVNYYRGTLMGYSCSEVEPRHVKFYRDACGRGKSINGIGDAWSDLNWGDVPIASFNPG
jgi:hypothetical protein